MMGIRRISCLEGLRLMEYIRRGNFDGGLIICYVVFIGMPCFSFSFFLGVCCVMLYNDVCMTRKHVFCLFVMLYILPKCNGN